MAERTESEGFYEMLWDCDHCGTKALLGKSQRHCAECGAPQNPDKRYFPSPEQAKLVDGHRYEGADRHCPACNAPMAATGKNCTQCGSPLDGSKEVKGVPAAPPPAKKKRPIWLYVLIGIALFIFLIWFFFIRHKAATLKLAGHRWERSIAIEKYGDWEQHAWRDQVPATATLPTCIRKERSRKQVPDGEACTEENVDKKDGTFEKVKKCHPKYRSEPVDDDWCTFTVRQWKVDSAVSLKGTGLDAKWPDNVPAASTPEALGATRQGARTEKLILDFGGDNTCEVDDAKWRKYKDGDKVKLEVRARSGAVVCSSL